MHNTIHFITRNVNENKKSSRLPRAYMVKPHYALIVGRVNTPFSHCKQACVGDGLLTL